MRKILILAIALATGCVLAAGRGPVASGPSLYDFEMKRIDVSAEPLSRYRGQVVMLVNVASLCGFTSQYEGLERLYETYRERGFVVLGFPSNDFGRQEPGSNEEIAEFCRATWSVRFPMFEKIRLKGDDKHPLYAYLTSQPAPIAGEIQWNFQKLLIGRDGAPVARVAPSTRPQDPELVARIESLLAAPDPAKGG